MSRPLRRKDPAAAAPPPAASNDAPEGDADLGDTKGPAPRVLQQSDVDCVLLNEDIVEKLKLLDYEKRLCQPKNLKALSRTYFAIAASNSNDQFNYFTSLYQWLCGLCGLNVSISKLDDPMTIVSNIVLEVKKVGIELEYPPIKLKQGSGEAVCVLLSQLVDRTLERAKFTFQKPVCKEDSFADEAQADDDAEIGGDIVDEAVPEEEEALYTDLIRTVAVQDDKNASHVASILESSVDPKEWQLELERVGPFLQVKLPSDNKEWRAHIQQTKQYEETMKASLPEAREQLQKLIEDLSRATEKISNKERSIHAQFEHMASQYREEHGKLQAVNVQYQSLSESVAKLTDEAQRIQDLLEEKTNQAKSQSENMTDTSPLVKIKQALQKIKAEIRQMEVRIGVVSHTLFQSRLKGRAKESSSSVLDGDNDLEESMG